MANDSQEKKVIVGELSRNEVSYINKVLSNITLHEVKLSEPKSLLKFKRALSLKDNESSEFLKASIEDLKPKNLQELIDDKTDEGKASLEIVSSEINEKYNKIAQEYMEDSVNIETDPVNVDDLFALAEKNEGFTLGLVEYICNKFSND